SGGRGSNPRSAFGSSAPDQSRAARSSCRTTRGILADRRGPRTGRWCGADDPPEHGPRAETDRTGSPASPPAHPSSPNPPSHLTATESHSMIDHEGFLKQNRHDSDIARREAEIPLSAAKRTSRDNPDDNLLL